MGGREDMGGIPMYTKFGESSMTTFMQRTYSKKVYVNDSVILMINENLLRSFLELHKKKHFNFIRKRLKLNREYCTFFIHKN